MPVIIWLCDRAMQFQSKPTFHPCSPQSPSSSVVRASALEHGGSWVQIPSGTWIFFFRVRCYLYLTQLVLFSISSRKYRELTEALSEFGSWVDVISNHRPRLPKSSATLKGHRKSRIQPNSNSFSPKSFQ